MPRLGRAWVAAPGGLLAALILLTVGVARGAAGASGAGGVSCVPSTLNGSSSLAGGHLTVSPAPESRDASATTQISLLGEPADAIQQLVVRGSRTGVHTGRLEPFSQGDGASFVPARPFDEGETVSVSARLQAGPSPVPVSWSFTVAFRDVPGTGAGSTFPALGRGLHQSFVSRPDLRPPTVTVTPGASLATGDVFLAPYSGQGQYGPMILDQHGGLIWFDPLTPGARAGGLQRPELSTASRC